MIRRKPVLLTLVLPALFCHAAVAAETMTPAAELMPPNTVVALEVSQPKALLDLALCPNMTEMVTSHPLYKEQTATPGFEQFRFLVGLVQDRLKTDWKTGLHTLLGGGVVLAMTADEEVILIVDSKDPKMLEELHDFFVNMTRSQSADQGNADRVKSSEYRGVTGWTFNSDEAHALLGSRLVFSNKPEALKDVIDRRQDGGTSLATLPGYQAAKETADPDAVGTVFVNLDVLKQAPGVGEALTSNQNPLIALLFAGVTEALAGSSWMSIGLDVDERKLSLEATVDGMAVDPDGVASFARSSSPDEGALPNISVPGLIAGMSFYRDLHGFYAAKDDLFPERTSGLIFFENMMGIFFTGRDLTDEVLANVEPELRVVVAEQTYDPEVGTTQMQIPGFAAVFRLSDPERFGVVVEEAWQKFIGLMNFTRGQQALPGLIIDKQTHEGVKFTIAYFSSADETDRSAVHMRYNFRPALAVVGDNLILSSTDTLTGDVIDALRKERADSKGPLSDTHSLVEVSATRLASILDANRDGLVRNNMVEEGSTRQQAETQISLLVAVIDAIGQVTLDIGSHEGQPQAKLDVELNLP